MESGSLHVPSTLAELLVHNVGGNLIPRQVVLGMRMCMCLTV